MGGDLPQHSAFQKSNQIISCNKSQGIRPTPKEYLGIFCDQITVYRRKWRTTRVAFKIWSCLKLGDKKVFVRNYANDFENKIDILLNYTPVI